MDTTMINSLIGDLALILLLGSIATVLFKKLKQPVVLGYIVAGFIASPHFAFFPSVTHESNIEFWAQIGIVVLLFSIGLEFSFKKLLNVGGSAAVTALIIVMGMMGLGFIVGRLLDFSAINALFLGAMLSMSSTTIIIKALNDLNFSRKRFVPLVLAVLIVEDLFAVLLLVILQSVAISKNVETKVMIDSLLRMALFLVVWFTVGIFVIPTLFKRYRKVISNEIMLIIAMALCFFTAVFAVKLGFSLALGAFVMGSIFAGTVEAERIERLITPIKDLFGAVFFISVGMMVDPTAIVAHAGSIALFSIVVVVGMIVFGTFGMLVMGQPLKIAMESGFCLTQIGEFSFIIASMGMSLGVLDKSLYPIIVAVSVITTFFTPTFMKLAIPCYNLLASHLPAKWSHRLDGYSQHAAEAQQSETRQLWNRIARRFVVRLVLYSVVVVMLRFASHMYIIPFMKQLVGASWGRLAGEVVSLAVMSPFLYAMMSPSFARHEERQRLLDIHARITYVPLFLMLVLGFVVAMALIMFEVYGTYRSTTAMITAVVLTLMILLLLSPQLFKRVKKMENRFISNANEREYHRTGQGNNLVSDLHLAYMTVGYDCPFVGERLKNADIRRKYGVNVVNIQRNSVLYPVPGGDMRIFPGDVLGVIGTDEQIQQMLPLVEASSDQTPTANDTKFQHFQITNASPLVGKTLENARLREDYGSLLVAVQRGDEYIAPTPDVEFRPADILWIVGDAKKLQPLRK